ncbi:hypothetical protein ELI00_29050 (plasmid) [Rhizobium ruizarguesonis]|uniref:hypothetical protein n=1 Tax=Rhizobium ruizarguesonis TaxID=2081791 RepID=UPI0010318E65|nr:hypothetical protein [Rhizobium ruizarguesonis]NEK04255.1 hypothetical protein [Rhizobium ruizarguesonis]TAX66727.1 hypothetical protein ELI00_29050 [Rhizobium ruizarguesonis]
MKTDDPSLFLHSACRRSGNNFRRTGVLGSGMTVARASKIVPHVCFLSQPVENQAAGWIARPCVVAQPIKEHRRNGCAAAIPLQGEGECEAYDQRWVVLANTRTPAGHGSAGSGRAAEYGRR